MDAHYDKIRVESAVKVNCCFCVETARKCDIVQRNASIFILLSVVGVFSVVSMLCVTTMELTRPVPYVAPTSWSGDNLTAHVHALIARSQNPVDCSKRRLLLCRCEQTCGLGCILHRLGLCLFVALGTDRVMIAQSRAFFLFGGYQASGLSDLLPVNGNCSYDGAGVDVVEWKGRGMDELTASHRVVSMTTTKGVPNRNTLFAPGTVPVSLLPLIRQAKVTEPVGWWAGQVMSYVMRPSAQFLADLDRAKKRIDFTHPIAGVHIRRTDKILEASYQEVEAYMALVADWFDREEVRRDEAIPERKVFVATDDRSVLVELERKYPSYLFIHQKWGRAELTLWFSIFTRSGISSTLLDVHLLALTDFVVCTFSSNIGRLVYELRLTRYRETGNRSSIATLDTSYHYPGGYKFDLEDANFTAVQYASLP